VKGRQVRVGSKGKRLEKGGLKNENKIEPDTFNKESARAFI